MAIDLGNDPGGTPPTAGEKLQIRSAIGVGQTDAPTFLAVNAAGNFLSTAAQPAFGKSNCQWLFSNPTNDAIYLQQTNGGPAGPVNFSNAGVTVENTCYFGIGGTSYAGSADVRLYKDAAGILAQRNGTNAQAFRVYNTFPGTGNNEYGQIAWTSNEFVVGSAISGSGSPRRTILSGNDIVFVASSGARWQITSAGLLAFADNTYDIGASGANRPRSLYVAGNSVFGTNTQSPTATPLNVSFGGTYGTSTPGTKANLKWDMYNPNTTSDRYGIGMSIGLMEFQAGTGGGFGFYPNNTTASALHILSGGNIGIGTTTPASKLQVTSGDIEVETVTNGIILKAAGTSTRYRLTLNAGGTALVFTAV